MNKYRAKALPCTQQFMTDYQRAMLNELQLRAGKASSISWDATDRAYLRVEVSPGIHLRATLDWIGRLSGVRLLVSVPVVRVGFPPYHRGGEYYPHPSILAWNDRTVPKLINQKAPSALIADALEEAGCTNKDLLLLFRRPIPHPEEWIYST